MVPDLRQRRVNDAPVAPAGRYVLYWMIAARRVQSNFALDRAIEWARELKRPLVIFEPLRIGYPWASDRLHRFVLEGMADNADELKGASAYYYPYVEPRAGAGKGLLAALAKEACVVVTDDFPAFFLPHMIERAAEQVEVLLEAVDSNGLLPLRAADKDYPTAYSFRRFLQKTLPEHLQAMPVADPINRLQLPRGKPTDKVLKRWPKADLDSLLSSGGLSRLPIDHQVGPAALSGGTNSARVALERFVRRIDKYVEERNDPDAQATSGLSGYLHFGHISTHEVFHRLMKRAKWTTDKLAAKATGSRSGWWGVDEATEAFLDQLITWRELGYNMAAHRQDYDQYESLPEWAKKTLAKHARDRRENLYTLEQFEQARTHDPLWNAAQRQLVREGRLHNYLRMLWGKKILEWTESPQVALEIMIELNNKYAVDGRDPNSYSGIFWTLGRYDRPWGPERKIFGTVRYMSSQNTARKVSVRAYLEKYGP